MINRVSVECFKFRLNLVYKGQVPNHAKIFFYNVLK